MPARTNVYLLRYKHNCIKLVQHDPTVGGEVTFTPMKYDCVLYRRYRVSCPTQK